MTDAPLGERTDERWPLLSRFREHGVPNARYIAVGMVGPVGTAMFGAMMPFVLGTVFDALFNEQPYALPLVPSAWIPTEPAAQVWFTGALLATLYVARAVVNTTGQYYRGLFGIKVQHDLRVAAYEALQRRRLSFFDDQQTGELMSVLNSDVSTLENFFSDAAPLFVFRVATLGWALLFMSLLNVRLALLGLVGAPLLVVLNLRFARRMEHAQDRARQAVGDLNATMGDYVGGISLIKTGTAEPQASATVAKRSRENFDRQWGLRKLRTAHRPAVNLVADATYLLVFLVGGYWVLRGPPPFAAGTLTGGELIAFLLYARQLVGPFAAITRTIDQYESAKASAKRVAAVTTAGSGGVDPDAGHPLADVDGRVEYDDVTFGYGDDPVLEDVSFEVAAGETVESASEALDAAADRVQRRPGVAIPTEAYPAGLAASTLLHAPFSGNESAAAGLVAELRDTDDSEAFDRRLASLVAIDTVTAEGATGRAAEQVERALRPYATPDGPFDTLGGYADVLEAVARTAPGTGTRLVLGRGGSDEALDAWRSHGETVHRLLREADTARHHGLTVLGVPGADPAALPAVARLSRDFRSPESLVLVVTDGAAAAAGTDGVDEAIAAAAEAVGGTGHGTETSGTARFDTDRTAFTDAFREAL